jgi:hypothetical protein
VEEWRWETRDSRETIAQYLAVLLYSTQQLLLRRPPAQISWVAGLVNAAGLFSIFFMLELHCSTMVPSYAHASLPGGGFPFDYTTYITIIPRPYTIVRCIAIITVVRVHTMHRCGRRPCCCGRRPCCCGWRPCCCVRRPWRRPDTTVLCATPLHYTRYHCTVLCTDTTVLCADSAILYTRIPLPYTDTTILYTRIPL